MEPGWGLWLARACTQGGDSGSVTLGLRVLRVERRNSFLRILAADALGLLDQTIARRPVQFDASCVTLAQAVEAPAGGPCGGAPSGTGPAAASARRGSSESRR